MKTWEIAPIMSELTSIANALIRWAGTDPLAAPLAISAARDLLCLEEAELRLTSMSRTASVDTVRRGLPEMFDSIRNTNRDCAEILRSISKLQSAGVVRPSPAMSHDVGQRAVERLVRLSNSADAAGRHPLAKAVDELVMAVTAA